ncbi:hypothetical protein [Aeromonas media]|uniref:hypothetical protein n=1 Tax=Aeromonas media TaxID=651 RepID=UPI001F16401C|nr:hypothetical protein [Aeromonas media]
MFSFVVEGAYSHPPYVPDLSGRDGHAFEQMLSRYEPTASGQRDEIAPILNEEIPHGPRH